MDVTVTLDFANDDQTELASILNCSTENLANELSKYGEAALQEYISMFLGQKVFKRGRDILEYRLFLLIERAYGNKIPGEQDVCKLFQTSSTESRSLIKAVISKYQYQLKTALEGTIKDTLQHAKRKDEKEPYTVTINSQNIVDELNRQLQIIDGSLPPVTKKRGSVSIYEIKASSYSRLCEKFNIKIRK